MRPFGQIDIPKEADDGAPYPLPRVLMLATNGFQEAELFDTRQALLDAGLKLTLASIDHA
jgi:hypothetical protein